MPLVTGKKPSQLKDPTAALDNNMFLVVELPNGDVVKIHPGELPGSGNGGGSLTSFKDQTGGNAPANPAAPANPPSGSSVGDTVVEFYDDQILYWTYDGSNWTLNNRQDLQSAADDYLESASLNGNNLVLTLAGGATISVDLSSLSDGGGAGLSIYDAGLGFWVKGTTGIAVTSDSQGIYDFDVPAGGILESFQKQFTNPGTEYTGGGEVQINIDWNTGAFNTNAANSVLPAFKLIPGNNQQFEPASLSVTVEHTSVGSGLTATTLANLNGVGTPVRIKGIL